MAAAAPVNVFAVAHAKRQFFTDLFANVSLEEARPAEKPAAVSSNPQADSMWSFSQRVRVVATGDGVPFIAMNDVIMVPTEALEAPGWESYSRSSNFLFMVVHEVVDGLMTVTYVGTLDNTVATGPAAIVGPVGSVFGFTYPMYVMRASNLLVPMVPHVVAAIAAGAQAALAAAGAGGGAPVVVGGGGDAGLANMIASGLAGGLAPFAGQLAQVAARQNADREQQGGAAKAADVARLRLIAGTLDDPKLFFSYMVAPPGGGADADAAGAALAAGADPDGLPTPRTLNWAFFATASGVDLNGTSGILGKARFVFSEEASKSHFGLLDFGPEGKASLINFQRGEPPVKITTVELVFDACESAAKIFARRGATSFAEGIRALRESVKDLLQLSDKANDFAFVVRLINYHVGRPFGDSRHLFVTGTDYGAVSLRDRMIRVMTLDPTSVEFNLAMFDIKAPPPPANRPPAGQGDKVKKRAADVESSKAPAKVAKGAPVVKTAGGLPLTSGGDGGGSTADKDYRTAFNAKALALGISKAFPVCRSWAGGKGACADQDGQACSVNARLVHNFPPSMIEGGKAKARALYASFNPPPI